MAPHALFELRLAPVARSTVLATTTVLGRGSSISSCQPNSVKVCATGQQCSNLFEKCLSTIHFHEDVPRVREADQGCQAVLQLLSADHPSSYMDKSVLHRRRRGQTQTQARLTGSICQPCMLTQHAFCVGSWRLASEALSASPSASQWTRASCRKAVFFSSLWRSGGSA